MNSTSPTSLLIQACKQGHRLFQRLGYAPVDDPLRGSRPVFDIRLPEVAEVVDFAGSRRVDPNTQCEILVDTYGGRQWVRDWAQSVFVAGPGSPRR